MATPILSDEIIGKIEYLITIISQVFLVSTINISVTYLNIDFPMKKGIIELYIFTNQNNHGK